MEQSSIVMSLKKQVNELRKKNETVEGEMADLKRSTKVCVYNELDVQLEAYSEECVRLRERLEQQVEKEMQQEKEIRRMRRSL